jgi:hypothetical protein
MRDTFGIVRQAELCMPSYPANCMYISGRGAWRIPEGLADDRLLRSHAFAWLVGSEAVAAVPEAFEIAVGLGVVNGSCRLPA